MKQNQTVRLVKQMKHQNIIFYTAANVKKRGVIQNNKRITKNSHYILNLAMEDMLQEQNFLHNDQKSLKQAFDKYTISTEDF